ncbi:MAG: hypothetical protein V4724_37800 [Pseudomonadota bacterium]
MQATHTEQHDGNPDVKTVIWTLGPARIAPYRSYFGCHDDKETLGAYFWGQAIAAALLPCLGMYEVLLRNAVHRSASNFASRKTSDSFPWYDITETTALTLRGRTKDKVIEVLYNTNRASPLRHSPQPSPDSVVAALSFGFWPAFLEGLTKREQPRILTDTFAFHPHSKPGYWSVTEVVTNLIGTLKKIQSLRNAVAHLEPIWKPHRLKGTETHWSHSVVSLREIHDEMLRIMTWCCPAAATAFEHSFGKRMFRSICSTTAVQAFMADPLASGEMKLFGATQSAEAVPALPAEPDK